MSDHDETGDECGHLRQRHSLAGPGDLWEMKRHFQIDVLRRFGLKSHHYLLDLGCGTLRGGIPIIRVLENGHYWGIDVRHEVLLEAHRELEENRLVCRSPMLLQVDDLAHLMLTQAFDVIWSFAVLIHMSDSVLDGALAAVARHLRPDGVLYASVNVGASVDGHWQGFPLVSREWAFYREAFAAHGLIVEDLGSLRSFGHQHPRLAEDRQERQRLIRARLPVDRS